MENVPFARHKLRNLIQTALLFLGMILLFAFIGGALAGSGGVILLAIVGLVISSFSRQISPRIVLRAYKARPLDRHEAPKLVAIIEELSARADLPRPPKLYYIPSRMVNAFSLGSRENAAIGVTDGILRSLSLRELTGVLAHEISHIRNNDLYVMGLADMVNSTTSSLSMFGQILLFINLPLMVAGGYRIPWLFILILMLAPTVSALLQLGLSRSREYDADLDAARLTGDPRGLASALAKLEQLQAGFLERIFLPGRRVPEPSLLRTHPPTKERVDRLLELEGEAMPKMDVPDGDVLVNPFVEPLQSRLSAPRWRYQRYWY